VVIDRGRRAREIRIADHDPIPRLAREAPLELVCGRERFDPARGIELRRQRRLAQVEQLLRIARAVSHVLGDEFLVREVGRDAW
jgi:hypothetical protein